MTAVTNTFVSTTAKGNREELSDVVNRITPEDTPIYSMGGKGTCKTTHPEWEIDTLAAPALNAQAEGDEYTFDAIDTPDRVGNYTQIMSKRFIISGTQDANDNAGNVEKTKYQKLKKGVELRKDIEFALASNTASVGTGTRKLGGLPSWITSNVSRGASGANGGFNSGTGLTVAATNGTQRAFTKTLMDDVMQQGYESGANFDHIVVSPYVKSVFVSFMSDSNVAPFRHAVKDGKGNGLISNADYYEGPHGMVKVVANRVMAGSADLARNAFMLDSDYYATPAYRKIKEDKNIAKTGDAKKTVLIGEMTSKVKNEAGLGVVADIFGLTAST